LSAKDEVKIRNVLRIFSNLSFKQICLNARINAGKFRFIPILLHHIIKNDSLLLKKLDTDEAVKEVNKIVSEYKNYYNSSSQYSNDEIEKIIDKYAMTKHLKRSENV